MTRPADWYPLAALDPVSGDPERVLAAGEEYARVARQIERAADELRAIASEMDGSSAAVDEVDDKATRLADTIERAHGRYRAAGSALQTYADSLADAQRISLDAHTAAVTALRAQDEALASVAWWTRMAERATEPPVRDRYLALADDARTDLAVADARLDAARADLQVAVRRRDQAVAVACGAIRGAMDRDDLHDSLGQDLGGGVQEVGLALWNGTDEVAMALSFAAVALCWVPGVNGVVAAAATLAGFAVLARDAVNVATGNGGWDDVRASAVGVAAFGLGRFAQQGVRLAVASERGGRALRHSGLADGVVGDVAAPRAVGEVTGDLGVVPSRVQTGSLAARSFEPGAAAVLRSGVLWRSMTPGAILRDTWNDLRGGVDLVRAPGLYRPSARGHVARPVDAVQSPLSEYRQEVLTTWSQNRAAGILTATGNEAAARGLASGAGVSSMGWVVTSGAVQVVEGACGLSPIAPGTPIQQVCAGTLPHASDGGSDRDGS